MPTRRDLLRSAALVPAAALPLSLASIDAALAQAVDLLKLFVPAAPGGGWDQTARTIEQVLRATGAVKGVQITNVGGAGGAVGLPQFLNQWKGQGNALMVAGIVIAGGGPATAALLGNQVAAGISGYGEFAEQVKAGKLRVIAISADKRQEDITAPTLKEEGIDVELFNWRGVFAPPGVNDAQRKAMIALMEKMTATPQWAEACKMRDWTQITLLGDDYKSFLDAETARIEGILKELGLA